MDVRTDRIKSVLDEEHDELARIEEREPEKHKMISLIHLEHVTLTFKGKILRIS